MNPFLYSTFVTLFFSKVHKWPPCILFMWISELPIKSQTQEVGTIQLILIAWNSLQTPPEIWGRRAVNHCGTEKYRCCKHFLKLWWHISSKYLWGSNFGTLWSSIAVLSSIWLNHLRKYSSLCMIIEVYGDLCKLSCWHVILSFEGFQPN